MDHAAFGLYLSSQRTLRGLSRDEVAKATRIPPTLVAALEDGQAERLPERIFVLNYVRSYALAVGLSADEAVTRYDEIAGVQAAPEVPPAELEVRRRKRAWRSLAVAVVVGALGTWLAMVVAGEWPSPVPGVTRRVAGARGAAQQP